MNARSLRVSHAVTALLLLAAGATGGSLLRPEIAEAVEPGWPAERIAVAAALGQARPYEAEPYEARLEAMGFLAGPAQAPDFLVVTEWVPEILDQEGCTAGSPALVGLDGGFTGDWTDVRNGLIVNAGEFLRNPSPRRVHVFGYVVRPSEVRTLADIDARVEETADLLSAQLEAIENRLVTIAEKEPPRLDRQVVDLLASTLGREVGTEVGVQVADVLRELVRKLERQAEQDAAREKSGGAASPS